MNTYEFYKKATSFEPYPYQVRLATNVTFPKILNVPTGVGKTAAVCLAWLYRRRYSDDAVRGATPRRLVYCLPMRTLVEQTNDAIHGWLTNLGIGDALKNGVGLSVLMGGADDEQWFEYPERDAILIGTQDMLLSRALNRGYGMSRYAWPVQYALLNNDCQWVLDETQLMGVGLTTSAQLAGFREKLEIYGNCSTMWMSATLDESALSTVDHALPKNESGTTVTIEQDDRRHPAVMRLLTAKKPCGAAATRLTTESKKSYASTLSGEILAAHRESTLTLVVVNRVVRAQDVFQAIKKRIGRQEDAPEVHLIHSRYRQVDRRETQAVALNEESIPKAGRILIATQAIEAGVDISATTMFTELAPWSSMVQRFGRCNRRGKCGVAEQPAAHIYWIDIDTADPKKVTDLGLPYESASLDLSRTTLMELGDVGPEALENVRVTEPRPISHVLRRKDLLDLFDTTTDLSGNDLDVSRYIRDSDDNDVQVYWREWDLKDKERKGWPPQPKIQKDRVEFPASSREELCSISIGAVRGNSGFISKAADKGLDCYTWNTLDGQWQVVKPNAVRPGMTLLLHCEAGGYAPELGWTADAKHSPVSDCRPKIGSLQEAMNQENLSSSPLTISAHLRDVGEAAEALQTLLKASFHEIPWPAIVSAAWWHDVGKSHEAFQGAVLASNSDLDPSQQWAKSGKRGYLGYQIVPAITDVNSDLLAKTKTQTRKGFRHELASALAWLQQNGHDMHADLVAYLIAAHHGKVRMTIRSMPNENRPPESDRLFARGIWDGDRLPEVAIGNTASDISHSFELSLAYMQLGEQNGQASWLARTVGLLESYGPFRLAYLESLVRIADWRGSQKGEQQ